MNYLFDFFIFIFGSAIGSFLNVVICRLETEEDIVKKRSHCPRCGQILRWYDLIPIVSFFILRGKCRDCKEKISWQYPIVEIATGVLFLLIFFNPPTPLCVRGAECLTPLVKGGAGGLDMLALFYLLYVACSLVVIFVYDLRHYIIPDVVLFPAIGAALAYRVFSAFVNLTPLTPLCVRGAGEAGLCSGAVFTPLVKGGAGGFYPFIISAIIASAFFLFLVLITRGRGMGIGDIKLSFLMGLMLGWPEILIALFLAFFSGATIGVILIFAGRKTIKSQIPFGPFLIASTPVALFWGQGIINFYQSFLIY